MRAARIIGPQRIEIIDAKEPTMQDGEVLVRVQLTSVCGSDLRRFDRALPEEEYPLPNAHPSHECAGVVEDSKSDLYQKGQRVIALPFNSTGLGEYMSVPASRIIPLPGEGDLATLLMCQHMGTVMFSCNQIGSVIGKSVVILGQGAIGLNFTYWMHRMGAKKIIVTDLIEHRLKVAKTLGATHTINVAKQDPVSELTNITKGELADVVIEAAGEPETVNEMFRVLKLQGLAIVFAEPRIHDEFLFDYDQMQNRLPTIVSTLSARTDDPTQCIKECVDLVAQGRLDLSHLVTHRLPFEQVQKAFDIYSRKLDNSLKVVLEI